MTALRQPGIENASGWSPRTSPPHGVRLENLRRRGVNVLRLNVLGPQLANRARNATLVAALLAVVWGTYSERVGLWFLISAILVTAALMLGRRPSIENWEISISHNLLSVVGRAEGMGPHFTRKLSFTDIEGITARRSGYGVRSGLIVATDSERIAIGEGLPEPTLTWLKNTLIMEVAGLTWKPLQSVNRRLSRTRSSVIANPILLTPDLALRLLGIFLEQAPDKISRLGVAVAEKDASAIRQHAHWLKSASANVGAMHLSDLCQLMQIYGAENDLARTGILFKEINCKNLEVLEWLGDIRETAASSIGLAVLEEQSPWLWEGPTATAEVESADLTERAAKSIGATAIIDAKVLVVDDSAISREIAQEFLSEIVAEAVFAHDGVTALELWEKDRFDLVLMDCEMFGMDGYECSTKLRRKESLLAGRRTPIVALTGHALKGDRARCIASGMDDYLSKPYSPEDLREKVEKWLIGTSAPTGKIESLESSAAESNAEAA